MSRRPATDEHLLPRPRHVRHHSGVFHLSGEVTIAPAAPADARRDDAASAARLLCRLVRRDTGRTWRVCHASRHTVDKPVIAIETCDQGRTPQSYTLRIRPDWIVVRAADSAGLRYGVLTLAQLVDSGCDSIRSMDLDDWPDFPVRSVMLDVSRDKVPTLATLKRLIDMLAGWKINQLQLYTEHTFAYAGHERVWRGASPLTGGQIEMLDRYCRERCVELVPNQNSFGHMERWLRHEPYARLAEMRGRWKTPWGEYRDVPTTLNPLDPASIRLVASLYDQLLPRFSSGLFNVGCDETFELGQGRSRRACERRGIGRVYRDFLLKIHAEVKRRGRRMMFWSDIAFEHPDLIADLPSDVVPLLWGYEADHPFAKQCSRLAESGLAFYVCPGTSSWCSFGGRIGNCLANLRSAAMHGKRNGASGYLITDWGDHGHRQYLPVSYPGFLYGAAVSWCVRANADIDVPREVARHVYGDETGLAGRLWCDLGAIQELPGVRLRNGSVLFRCMQGELGDAAAVAGLTRRGIETMAGRMESLWARARAAQFGGDDGVLVRRELLATLSVLRHACRRARLAVAQEVRGGARREHESLARDIERIIERHRELWLARNRRGGLASSVGYYLRNLKEYRR
ncbi:MAG: family 20 glycosylhydrolase [Planctomycetota bacterium]